jgi:asparagine synthase (glutamine-hydrolysing)
MLRLKDPRDYEQAVRAELDRAVQSRLRGARDRIGTQLSGGLDSSAVTATAAVQLPASASLIAYTSAPRPDYRCGRPNVIADEWPLAAATAALYPNITHVRIPASGSSPLARLDFYFQIFDRPILNLCNSVWTSAMLDDARSRGLRVMLSGEAGNLSFSYHGMAALSQMLSERRWGSLARTSVGLIRGGTRIGTVAAQLIAPHLPVSVWQAISRLRGKGRRLSDYTLVNPALEQSLLKTAAATGSDTSRRPPLDAHRSRIWGLQHGDSGNTNKGYLGGWGVDFRDPTADRRLVELCLTIPPEQFLLGGKPRSLARRAFADRLPAAVLHEQRKGYQAADWHEALTAARPEVSAELARCARVPEVRDLMATRTMNRLLDEWPTDGNWNSDERIQKYRLALLRGTSAAHFTRRSTGSNQ